MTTPNISLADAPAPESRRALPAILLTLLLVAALVTYKGSAALTRLGAASNGTVRWQTFAGQTATSGTAQYLRIVWPALVFGVLISAAVQLAIPARVAARLLAARGARQQAVAALAGAPLMLCSCCVSPIFTSLYRRTRSLGPSLAFTLAAPSLNPASLALAFMLLPARVAAAKLAMSLTLVLAGSALVARLSGKAAILPEMDVAHNDADDPPSSGSLLLDFLRSLVDVSWRTVPWIVLGVLASFYVAQRLPLQAAFSATPAWWLMAVTALVAVLMALPTFFEIPLALAALAAGAPAGLAAVILFAGPAINLASLLVIGRASSWRIAALLTLTTWGIALGGGLLVGR